MAANNRYVVELHVDWREWQSGVVEACKVLFGETEASTAFMEDFVKTSNAFHSQHMRKVIALSKAQS